MSTPNKHAPSNAPPADIAQSLVSRDADLVLGVIATAFVFAFVFVPYLQDTPVRPLLVLVFVFLIPGYTLIAAIFPRKGLGWGERIVLSCAFSIATVSLIGFGLNYIWNLNEGPIAVGLGTFVFIATAVAYGRRQAVPTEERFVVRFPGGHTLRERVLPPSDSRFSRVLTVILILSVLASVSGFIYVLGVPKNAETFTEFYVLGASGKADDYPTQFNLGQQEPVTVGVVNHENSEQLYQLVIALNNSRTTSTLYSQNITLANAQTWQKTVELKPNRAGNNMRVDFLLYRADDYAAPYRSLHLWVNVTR
ncbi:MAG: DUF1616 domain-containing protein [Halobacteriota archaeon]|jgi:uncharacterized membrane protein